MKFSVTFKDPDGVHEAFSEAARESVENVEGLSADEKKDLIEQRREQVAEAAQRWIEYGEYLTVDFDTDAGTATVRTNR